MEPTNTVSTAASVVGIRLSAPAPQRSVSFLRLHVRLNATVQSADDAANIDLKPMADILEIVTSFLFDAKELDHW